MNYGKIDIGIFVLDLLNLVSFSTTLQSLIKLGIFKLRKLFERCCHRLMCFSVLFKRLLSLWFS